MGQNQDVQARKQQKHSIFARACVGGLIVLLCPVMGLLTQANLVCEQAQGARAHHREREGGGNHMGELDFTHYSFFLFSSQKKIR